MALTNKLTAIADAIRLKTGKSGTMTLDEMPTKISAISSVEKVEWHQCPELPRNFINNVTYDANDYTVSSIADYAPASAMPITNTKPIAVSIDGTEYRNEVPNVETPFATSSKGGTLKPLDKVRWLNTSTPNVRDLGGWDCDGGTVKYGMLFRGGEPLTSDKSLMVDTVGIRHELQLRGDSDIPQRHSLWGIDWSCPAKYVWLSLTPTDTWKEILGTVFANVKSLKPTYFHCAAGADRTGTVAVMLEALLGVSESDISKDYELTCFYTGTGNDDVARRRNEDEFKNYITAIKSVGLRGSLEDTFANHAVSFALSLGFTVDEINAYRTAMINGTPSVIPEMPTNQIDISQDINGNVIGLQENMRWNSDCTLVEATDFMSSGYIPVKNGDIVRFEGMTFGAFADGLSNINYFDASHNMLANGYRLTPSNIVSDKRTEWYDSSVLLFTDMKYGNDGSLIEFKISTAQYPIAYITVTWKYYKNACITIERKDGGAGGYTNWIPLSINKDGTPFNDGLGYKDGYRYSSSLAQKANSGSFITGLIPVKKGDVIRFSGNIFSGTSGNYNNGMYKSDKTTDISGFASNTQYALSDPSTYATGLALIEPYDYDSSTHVLHSLTVNSDDAAYMCFTLTGSGEGAVITINEEITDTEQPQYNLNLIPTSVTSDGVTIYNGIGYKNNVRLRTDGIAEAELSGQFATGFFPVAAGDIIRIKGATYNNNFTKIVGYDSSFTNRIDHFYYDGWDSGNWTIIEEPDGTLACTLESNNIAWARFTAIGDGANVIITRNEKIS